MRKVKLCTTIPYFERSLCVGLAVVNLRETRPLRWIFLMFSVDKTNFRILHNHFRRGQIPW